MMLDSNGDQSSVCEDLLGNTEQAYEVNDLGLIDSNKSPCATQVRHSVKDRA